MPRRINKTPRHLVPVRVRVARTTLIIRPVAIHEAGHLLVAIEHGDEIDHAALRQHREASGAFDVDTDMLSRRRLGYVRRKSLVRGNRQRGSQSDGIPKDIDRVFKEVDIKIAGRLAIEIITGDNQLARLGSRKDYDQARWAIIKHGQPCGSTCCIIEDQVSKMLALREIAVALSFPNGLTICFVWRRCWMLNCG